MLKYVPESKITIGTPAKFRKWYNAREGDRPSIIDENGLSYWEHWWRAMKLSIHFLFMLFYPMY